jgi:hypothetical protein
MEFKLIQKTGVIEKFDSYFAPVPTTDSIIESKQHNWSDIKIKSLNNKPIIWLFNKYVNSARYWLSFGSRRHREAPASIDELCIDSILLNSSRDFNVVVFNQDDVEHLLPEFYNTNYKYFKLISKNYSYHTFIQYAILHKYGGYWIPTDTIMVKSISNTIPIYNNGICLTFLKNNLNYYDNSGVSDIILAATADNIFIKKTLAYIVANLISFQNEFAFKRAVNHYFNSLVYSNTKHQYIPIGANQDINGKFLKEEYYYSSNEVRLLGENNGKVALIPLYMWHTAILPKYNYILRMSKTQILESPFQITKWLKQGLGEQSKVIDNTIANDDENLYAFGTKSLVYKQ